MWTATTLVRGTMRCHSALLGKIEANGLPDTCPRQTNPLIALPQPGPLYLRRQQTAHDK